MPRDIPVGNGGLLFCYDRQGFLRDIYFPYIGKENHAQGHKFRIGLWVDSAFSWLDDPGWQHALDYEDDTLTASLKFTNGDLGLQLHFRDTVDFHENLFVREIMIHNQTDNEREVRLFFNHDFLLYGTVVGDTACYKPHEKALLHYKGNRYFFINGWAGPKAGFQQYTTGVKGIRGLQGTWVDAEDGELAGHPIAQGSVDSTAALHLRVSSHDASRAYYWIAAGRKWSEVKQLNDCVIKRHPASYIRRTTDYWRLWVNKDDANYADLPPEAGRLYKRSLLILRTNIDNHGSIIAGNDSDILQFNCDTYSYHWPRDGAIVAHALDLAGYPIPSRKFFDFCAETISNDGYFLHKYNPDRSLASSWHPWVMEGKPILPIQEDETGLVLWALWEHFRLYRDLEFIKPIYRPLIKAAAEFLSRYIDPETGLPLPSYDLWEEKRGIHCYTVCTVMAGLNAAMRFTKAFGETGLAEKYRDAYRRMRDGLTQHLFDGDSGRYVRTIFLQPDGRFKIDDTLDASLYGLFAFGGFPVEDDKVMATMRAVHKGLWCHTRIGGLARYENDTYQRDMQNNGNIPGNPWIICTLWYARYRIETARNRVELDKALSLLLWVVERALPSGVLAEQVHSETGEPVSISPLSWSHAEFILTVKSYLSRSRVFKQG